MGKPPHLSPGRPQSSQEVRSIYVSEDMMHMRLPPPVFWVPSLPLPVWDLLAEPSSVLSNRCLEERELGVLKQSNSPSQRGSCSALSLCTPLHQKCLGNRSFWNPYHLFRMRALSVPPISFDFSPCVVCFLPRVSAICLCRVCTCLCMCACVYVFYVCFPLQTVCIIPKWPKILTFNSHDHMMRGPLFLFLLFPLLPPSSLTDEPLGFCREGAYHLKEVPWEVGWGCVQGKRKGLHHKPMQTFVHSQPSFQVLREVLWLAELEKENKTLSILTKNLTLGCTHSPHVVYVSQRSLPGQAWKRDLVGWQG